MPLFRLVGASILRDLFYCYMLSRMSCLCYDMLICLYASDYVQYLLSVQYKFWDSSYVSICFSARISVSVFSICLVFVSVFVLELFCFQYPVA
ncbi:hypothetical protein HanRHA438_Chr16g0777651 [Helianthus annuus]|nr:hypothetical protein HanRHA438_Chr16g0777651 [Helianthus annuus]